MDSLVSQSDLIRQKFNLAENAQIYPLTREQQGLWFLDKLKADNNGYVISVAYKISGNLSVKKLRHAIKQTTDLFATYRTGFIEFNDDIYQVVYPNCPDSFEFIDLSDPKNSTSEQDILNIFAKKHNERFDLHSQGLCRYYLIKQTAERYYYLGIHHHIISDGFSASLLARAISIAYNNDPEALKKQFSNQNNVGVYHDYLNTNYSKSRANEIISYWQKRLDGARFQMDYGYPVSRKTLLLHSAEFQLGKANYHAIKQLCKSEKTTVFLFMVGLLNTLLYRYYQQNDITIGYLVNTRPPGHKDLLGYYVKHLPLRTKLSGKDTFLELLQQIKSNRKQDKLYSDIAFIDLVNVLRSSNPQEHYSDFSIAINETFFTIDTLDLDGLSVESINTYTAESERDLTFLYDPRHEELACSLQYNPTIFSDEQIQQMVRSLTQLVSCLLDTPNASLDALNALNQQEQIVFNSWNNAVSQYPKKCVHQLFSAQATKTPHAIALVFNDQHLTYRKLDEKSSKLSVFLQQSYPLKPDTLIAISTERSLDMIIGMLAVLKAGCAYVTLDPNYPDKRLQYMLNDSHVDIILTQTHLADKFKSLLSLDSATVCIDHASSFITTQKTNRDNSHLSHLAYVIYTSGSTGKPKGVMISHGALTNFLTAMTHEPGIQANDRLLAVTTYCFDISVLELFLPLIAGAQCILCPPTAAKDAYELEHVINKTQPSIMQATPATWDMLLQNSDINLHGLKILCGGEALNKQLATLLLKRNSSVWNMYGPTETTIWSSLQKVTKDTCITIGHPIANTQLYVLNKDNTQTSPYVTGELCISGAGLAQGYLNQPQLTADKFIPHPFKPGERLYRTGDLARRTADGTIEYLGRIDEQIKLRGHRIELREVESWLNEHPSIQRAIVVTKEINANKQLVAYFRSESNIPSAELKSFLQQHLPGYMLPTVFFNIDHIPLTANGKVDRKRLASLPIDVASTVLHVPPKTVVERKLVEIWQDILQIDRVSIHDNFFELGGHSLLATQLASRIRKTFNIEFSLALIFDAPTIVSLAPHIDLAATQNTVPLKKAKRPTTIPLSYAQERMWFLDQLDSQRRYTISGAFTLKGKLNKQALQHAFQTIIKRHEILRTCFKQRKEQVILPNASIDINYINVKHGDSQHSYKTPDAIHSVHTIRTIIQNELATPFDLSIAPLLRITVMQVVDDSSIEGHIDNHILLITMHHIITDGWSVGVMINEINHLYRAFIDGAHNPLPPLSIQYADYTLWQRQALNADNIAHQTEYWQQHLAGYTHVLELPTDFQRPPVQSGQGKHIRFHLTEELTHKINALSHQYSCTAFMLNLAAIYILLQRYTQQQDICIGIPVANRTQPELENLIGFFVNTLALRINPQGKRTIEELLLEARQVVLQAMQNQDVPFEQLVKSIQPQRDMSRTPIFQVMLAYQDSLAEHTIDLPNLEVESLELENDVAKYDLTFTVSKLPGRFKFDIEYSTDLFRSSTIYRMKNHLVNILEAFADDPKKTIDDIDILTTPEREKLLIEWNRSFDTDTRTEQRLDDIFVKQATQTPQATAVVFENEQINYYELNKKSEQLACYIQSLELKPGTIIGLCAVPSIEFIIALLAILRAGHVYLPLSPDYPEKRLQYIVEDSKAGILLTQNHFSKKCAAISNADCKQINFANVWSTIAASNSLQKPLQTTTPKDDVAYVIYTSGSTGQPKGVKGTHRATINRLAWAWKKFPLQPNEVFSQKTAISFVDHITEIFHPLLLGAPQAIIPHEKIKHIPDLFSSILTQRISRIVLVPSLLRMLLEHDEAHTLNTLKFVFCSGEPLTLPLVKLFFEKLPEVRLINIYGSTETSADATAYEVTYPQYLDILKYFYTDTVLNTDLANKTAIDLPFNRQLALPNQSLITKENIALDELKSRFSTVLNLESPMPFADYLDILEKDVFPYLVNTTSPFFIGHMTSVLPNFMADFTKLITQLNQNLVKVETSKVLTFIERQTIAMLHKLFYNFTQSFYEACSQDPLHVLGLITSGGTTANITALWYAYNKSIIKKGISSTELQQKGAHHCIRSLGFNNAVILGSRLMHYSFRKAASLFGIGEENILYVNQYADQKMQASALEKLIETCEKNRLYIMAIVGIAGATETGTVDPLDAMAKIAEKYNIHFHVDAAWGGPFVFSETYRYKLFGIEQADSMTICGHKQLYLPQGISVCLFKETQFFCELATHANYQARQGSYDAGQFSLEGSRPALSLLLHATLNLIAKKGYAWLIDQSMLKTKHFQQLINSHEAFELVGEPELNIVNYRYIPKGLRAKQDYSVADNNIISKAVEKIQEEQFLNGKSFVSKTKLDIKKYTNQSLSVFRVVIANPLTDFEILESILDEQIQIASTHVEHETQNKYSSFTVDSTDIQEALEKRTVPIGKPIANTQIYILGQNNQLVPIGVTGEICVAGACLSAGYIHNASLTEQKFVICPFNPKSKMYKTGDLGRWLSDGTIEFVGRSDNQVNIRGFRIELGEIEYQLNSHPEIKHSVVIVKEMNNGQNKDSYLVAYFTLHTIHGKQTLNLRQYLKQRLPEYMLPTWFVELAQIPLTTNGKVDRQALLRLPIKKENKHHTQPTTQTEQHLVTIFQEVLDLKSVSIHDNFFELGGHSLLATQLLSRINQQFSVNMSLESIFKEPTVFGLGEIIKQQSKKIQHLSEMTSVTRHQDHILSYAQRRLWYLNQLDPNSAAYNLSTAVQIEGCLNVAALKSAINEIIKRHEILRTVFLTNRGKPIQHILPELTLDIKEYTVPESSLIGSQTSINTIIKSQAQTVFDLTKAPLIRAALIKQDVSHSNNLFTLCITMHHIICDGWSFGVFIKEFSQLYSAFAKNRQPIINSIPVQYVDFTYWQQSWLSKDVMDAQLNYWIKKLKNVQSTALISDFAGSQENPTRGNTQLFTFPDDLVAKLKVFCQQHALTLFMLLMSAFNALLFSYTKKKDIVIGTDVANRRHPATDHMIGFFVNQIVLRAQLTPTMSFKDVLATVKTTALEAYDHQDVPFDKVVSALNKSESDPLFQTKFVLQNANVTAIDLPDIRTTFLPIDNETAKFDLLVNMEQSDQSLKGWVQYNADRYTINTIELFIKNFERTINFLLNDIGMQLESYSNVIKHTNDKHSYKKGQQLEHSNISMLKNIKRRVN